jgi:long-chain acyl-CoA synthetase
VRVVDPETLEALPQGRAGELWVRSDPMVTSYWRRPRRTAAAFVEADGKPWYRTGDIMRLDAEGYLYFIDRVADAVSPNGAVSITEIESALQEHPAVTAACVVGAAEDDRLKAFVVLKENQRGVAGSDLTAWLAARLPEHKVPQYIEFRDALPKSKVGKLLRRELKGEEEELARKGRWDQTVED